MSQPLFFPDTPPSSPDDSVSGQSASVVPSDFYLLMFLPCVGSSHSICEGWNGLCIPGEVMEGNFHSWLMRELPLLLSFFLELYVEEPVTMPGDP